MALFKALFKVMGLALRGLAKVGKMAIAKGKQAVKAATKGGKKVAGKAGQSLDAAGSASRSGNKARDMSNADKLNKKGPGCA